LVFKCQCRFEPGPRYKLLFDLQVGAFFYPDLLIDMPGKKPVPPKGNETRAFCESNREARPEVHRKRL